MSGAALTDEVGAAADPLRHDERRDRLRQTVREVIARVAPEERITALDEQEQFDEELARALAAAGVFGQGDDGPGVTGDIRDQAAVIEELAAGPTSMAVYTIVHYMAVHLVSTYGSAAQQERWLGPLQRGQMWGSFALSEAGGGTDVLRAMTTSVRREPDGSWVLNGGKRWIGGVQRAGVLVVLAKDGDAPAGVDSVTMLCVPGGTPGVTARVIDTMSIRGLEQNDVTFDDVRLSPDAVLGEPGQGFRQVLSTLNRERINCAASALGIARGALRVSVERAAEREAFGRPVGAFQVLQHRLVDGALAVEAAAGLLARATAIEAAGGRADLVASMAKIAASEAAVKVTTDGVQLFGGYGLDRSLPIQRYFRDARLYTFAPLTNEMMRNHLGEKLIGLPRSF